VVVILVDTRVTRNTYHRVGPFLKPEELIFLSKKNDDECTKNKHGEDRELPAGCIVGNTVVVVAFSPAYDRMDGPHDRFY